MAGQRSPNWVRASWGVVFFPALMATLWWARPVLIPVALAVLLTFLLGPVATQIERLRIGRVPAVLVVVFLVFTLLFGGGYLVTQQITALGLYLQVPEQQANFMQKVAFLSGKIRTLERWRKTVEKAETGGVEPAAGKPDEERKASEDAREPQPVQVTVQDAPLSGADLVRSALSTLGEPLAAAGLVVALVFFMLIQREDLRNRVIRLIGYGRLTLTTRALDEAGERISRYLLAQTMVNGTFGLGIAVGLFLIGVPYALLWGFLATVLRFIPYLGPLVAAGLPLAFSLFVFKGWTGPLIAAALFAALELLTNMVLEPLLYGRSAGVSQVALLIAIAFWTWLWGPIGLLLATPLTVCIAVLGRNVPQLESLGILLGDEPVLEPSTSFYQRLIAGDEDEAMSIAEEAAKKKSTVEVYDRVLLPALVSGRRDLAAERIGPEHERFIYETTRYAIEELASRQRKDAERAKEAGEGSGPGSAVAGPPLKVLACPARGEADEIALEMLDQLFQGTRVRFRIASSRLLAAELVTLCAEDKPDVVCLAALPPGGLAQVRYLLKRLRAECAVPRVIVGRWGLKPGAERGREILVAAGADQVDITLAETREQLLGVVPLDSRDSSSPARPAVGATAR